MAITIISSISVKPRSMRYLSFSWLGQGRLRGAQSQGEGPMVSRTGRSCVSAFPEKLQNFANNAEISAEISTENKTGW
jgi:hypothetical protein